MRDAKTRRKAPLKSQTPKRGVQRPKARTVQPGRTRVTKRPVKITRRKTRRRVNASTPEDLKWVEEDPKDHLLSRYIKDSKGKVVGESIGVEGKYIIMKNGLKFYSIPLRNIVELETELRLKGRINRDKARKLGEEWRKKALDPLYQKKKK